MGLNTAIDSICIRLSGNWIIIMSFEGFEFTKSGTQERDTGLMWTDNFVASFLNGTLNIGIDLRLKEEGELVRAWIARRKKSVVRRSCHNLLVQVADQKREAGEVRSVVADVAFENSQGIGKGRLGPGVFQSLMFGNTPYVAPPFWWRTGYLLLDRSVLAAQDAEYGFNGGIASYDDLFRYRISADLLEAFRGVGWTVESRGLAIQTIDPRIEVVDAFYGPFN